jgi:ABC-type multidrug transport system ATPase subunit
LTGRENIYLNGAILGMRKREIDRKLDEIIDFSGVERYIDTPVKRYSSGMYVRLAFAVAAHLESEILIVDEVLAVGDAEFQKKCLGKMGEVSKGEGRTVLFVSHNMAAVQSLCGKGIFFQSGLMQSQGLIQDVVNNYLDNNWREINEYYKSDIQINKGVQLTELKLLSKSLLTSHEIGFQIEYEIREENFLVDLSILLSDKNELKILQSVHKTNKYKKGKYTFDVWFPANLLNNIDYILTVGLSTLNPIEIHESVSIKFTVEEDLNSISRLNNDYRGVYHGMVRPNLKWIEKQKL